MPDDKDSQTQATQDVAAQTPPPSYVTKEELQTMTTGLLERVQGLLEGAATRFAAPTAPTAPTAPSVPVVTAEEINEALAQGQGAAEKIQRLVNSTVQGAVQTALAEHVTPLRTVGLTNLEQMAKATALNGLKYGKDFEAEITKTMAGVPAESRASVDAWRKAYELTVGAHHDEIVRREVEAAVRSANAQRPEQTPSGSSAVLTDDDGAPLPTIDELAGADGARTLRDKGVQNLDELARRMGYADAKAYLKMTKEIEKYNGDLL